MKPIDDIIENFDWQKVRNYMVDTGWTWGMGDGAYVPTIKQMKDQVRRMYQNMKKEDLQITGTGGFHMYRNEEEYWLFFYIADWMAERKSVDKRLSKESAISMS